MSTGQHLLARITARWLRSAAHDGWVHFDRATGAQKRLVGYPSAGLAHTQMAESSTNVLPAG
jgi:hypothetical protein